MLSSAYSSLLGGPESSSFILSLWYQKIEYELPGDAKLEGLLWFGFTSRSEIRGQRESVL